MGPRTSDDIGVRSTTRARAAVVAWRVPGPCVHAVLIALACASGCDLRLRDASIMVLVVAGVVVALGNGLVGLLWLMWRRVRPELGFRWRPFVTIGSALSGLGLVAMMLPYHNVRIEGLVLALWVVGTSYLTLLLLVWRMKLSEPDGLAWAHGIAGVLFLPALPFAFMPTDVLMPEGLMWFWLLPGFVGLVCGPLFGVLLVEAFMRRRGIESLEE